MAITQFNPSSGDDVISLSAFSDFNFGMQGIDSKTSITTQHQSPPSTSDESPESSAVPLGEAFGDDEDNSEDGDALSKKRPGLASTGPAKRGKTSSAERRATHNAIERARRESLNGRFLELASALPTMANVKRPSKSIIVNKSLEWIYESQIREHALAKENNALRAELNEMRARLHMPLLSTPAALPAAFDYGRNKGGLTAQPTAMAFQNQPPPAIAADGYFGTGMSFGSLPSAHHSVHLPGFATSAGPAPPSAPANMLAFSNPFNAATSGSETALHCAGSPESRSDSGSEAASVGADRKDSLGQPAAGLGGPFDSPRSFSSLGDSIYSASSRGGDKVIPAAQSAGQFSTLQAAYSQQQQYAALAAVACGQPTQPANANWSLMF